MYDGEYDYANLFVHGGKQALQRRECSGMTDRPGKALGERAAPPDW